MLVKFLAYTGALNDDKDAQRALDYLLGDVVLKPDEDGTLAPTPRARPPEVLSGCPELVRRSCASLTFKHVYASGVLAFDAGDLDISAFQAGDPVIRGICDELMRDFEATAFAGIPAVDRPPVLWIAHTDKDRLELNFLFPRAVADANGKIRAINPKPPRHAFMAMWDAFRDSWNCREGWADPEDPNRHRSLRLSSQVLKAARPKGPDGKVAPYLQEDLADRIGAAIAAGRITCRDHVIAWLEREGFAINRTSASFLSVKLPLPAEPGAARNAPTQYGKPVRLKGDIFDQRFTSVAWLEKVGYFGRETPAPGRDLSRARATLETLRDRFAAHHRQMLGVVPDDHALPPAKTAREVDRSQDPDVPGHGELIDIPACDPTDHSVPIEPVPGPRPVWTSRSPEEGPRVWEDRYRPPHLSAALADQLHHVDSDTRSVWLRDGSSIQDEDVRLRAFRGTDDTIRLMIAQALARGWSGLNMRGDEAFLRLAARLAVEAGLEMAGRDDAMDAIVQDERARLMAEAMESTGPAPEGAPRDAAPAAPRGEVRDSRTATRRRRPCGDARQPDHGTDAPPFTSQAVRFWQRLYGVGSLPNDLAPSLRQVDPDRGIITLTDGARLHDRNARIEASRTSAAAFRLVIAQARSKGWSGISIRGDEAFLRLAARIAVEENFPIEGRTPEMEAIIDDEVRRHYDDLVMAAGDAAEQADIDPRDGADGDPAPGNDRQEAGAGLDPDAEPEPWAGVDDGLGL